MKKILSILVISMLMGNIINAQCTCGTVPNWNQSFIKIGFTPDISIDGNNNNDDSNAENNSLTKSDKEINAMILKEISSDFFWCAVKNLTAKKEIPLV